MRKALPWIYLSLSILGAVLPWKANLEFIAESGGQAFDLARFIADASSTAAARSPSADLLIGATAVPLGTPVVSDNCDPDPAVSNDAPALFTLGTTASRVQNKEVKSV